jgi:type II secretory ATPase GspE/PulE/Tfp pilus assembly ATPase PilB-like protein
MVKTLLAQADVWGGYVAIWKVVIFLLLFVGWAWVASWLNQDTIVVHARRMFWNNVYVWSGSGAVLLWFLLPAPFWLSLMLFAVVWATVTLTYVLHRNARVPRDLRVLTPEHIRSVVRRENREVEARLTFISALGNELPVPDKRDREYQGWLTAEDVLYEVTVGRVSRAEFRPEGDEYQVGYLVDGVGGRGSNRVRLEMERGLSYLKSAGGLEVEERRRPQKGKFKVRIGGDEVMWNLRTAGSTRGEQMVLEREEEGRLLRVESLGFDKGQLEQMREVLREPAGVVLITGPAGSGTTTTLYGIMKEHDAFIQNINTLEKERLRDIDNVTQHMMGDKEEADPARQLQSVLRTDPDVVGVGFTETAEMAKVGTQGALDGKKLYFVLPAPSAFHALQTWMQLVGDPRKVARTLRAITNQRLYRQLCDECRQAYVPDGGLLKKLNLPAERIKRFYRAGELQRDKRGNVIRCEKCQGMGYFDRTAVFETLVVTEAIRKLMAENAPINAIRSHCRQQKMLLLQEQVLRRVIDGRTSIQEMLRVTGQRVEGQAVSGRSGGGSLEETDGTKE